MRFAKILLCLLAMIGHQAYAYNADENLALGMGYYQKAQYDSAVVYLTQALQEKATVQGYHYRGLCYSDSNLDNSALQDFNFAIEIDSTHAPSYYQRGLIYFKQTDNKNAYADFDRAIKFNPNLPLAYVYRGILKKRLEAFDEAMADYNKVINELNRDLPQAYFNRALLHQAMGNPRLALEDFNQTLRLAPNIIIAYYHRGSIHQELGEKQLAVKDYEKFLEEASDYPSLRPMIPQVKRIMKKLR